jgi:hypothetical protein
VAPRGAVRLSGVSPFPNPGAGTAFNYTPLFASLGVGMGLTRRGLAILKTDVIRNVERMRQLGFRIGRIGHSDLLIDE